MTTPIDARPSSSGLTQGPPPGASSKNGGAPSDPHDAFVKIGAETSAAVVNQAQVAALAPLAPCGPSIGPPLKVPFAGSDPGGLFAGIDLSNGKHAMSALAYGSEGWFSAHSDAGYRHASGNEARGGGFIGTDGRDFAQLSLAGSYYNSARRIGSRMGGGVFVSAKKATVDVTDTLRPDQRPPEGTRLLRTTHLRRRFNIHGLLSFAGLSFLRLFLRIERRAPVEITWDHRETDRAKIRAETGADRHPLRAGIAARVQGLRNVQTGPALRDCMTGLKNGDSLTYTCTQQRGFLGMLGMYLTAGRQKHDLVRSQVKVAKADGKLTVTLQRITDDGRSWFGILPGGALAAREWHQPAVESWTYVFNGKEEAPFQALIDAGFHPERGILRDRLQSDLCAAQLQGHAETERSSQTQTEVGLHMMQPRWLVKRWLPTHFKLGFGNHTGKLVTTVRMTPRQGHATLVDTRERRNQATRGADGLLQEIITSRFVRPAEGDDLAQAHLLLRVKHKHSHSTPQTVQRAVVGPLASMLGATVGSLVTDATPAWASPHAINVGLDLQVPQLVALAQFRGRDLPDALPDPTLRRALQDCIDRWGGPERVAQAPLAAFESLRDLMESTADRSTEDATLLLGALGFLLHQAGQGNTLELNHKAAAYREPAKLAATLRTQYGDQPMGDINSVRRRFRDVRNALVRIDFARHLLRADHTDPGLRAVYEPEMSRAVEALRALLHVENDVEREQIAAALRPHGWGSGHDAYIFAVLCASKPGSLAQDPQRRGQALHDGWGTFVNRDLRNQQREASIAALKAQSARMGEPGFPYSVDATRNLRGALRTLHADLFGLQ